MLLGTGGLPGPSVGHSCAGSDGAKRDGDETVRLPTVTRKENATPPTATTAEVCHRTLHHPQLAHVPSLLVH